MKRDIAVVGSRAFEDYNFLEKSITLIFKPKHINKIISGGAIGTDSLAEIFANKHKIPLQIFNPDWGKYGKAAGIIRNNDIIENADFVFVFWDGKSKGTKHDIQLCYKKSKNHIVLFF